MADHSHYRRLLRRELVQATVTVVEISVAAVKILEPALQALARALLEQAAVALASLENRRQLPSWARLWRAPLLQL